MEPISKEEIGWLAGILDGEGCLQVGQRTGKRNIRHRMSIEVNNVSPLLIYKLSILYNKLGIRFCYAFGKNKADNQFLRILIDSQKAIKTVLELVRPYLSAKLTQANLMLEFIYWRETLPHKVVGSELSQVIGRYQQLYENLKAAHRERFDLQRLPRRASEILDISKLEVMV